MTVEVDGAIQVVEVSGVAVPGPQGPQGPPGPPGSGTAHVGTWNWSNSTAVPPQSGQARTNTATWATATLLRLSTTTGPGTDVSPWLPSFDVGQQIRMQQKSDSSRWATFDVVALAVMQASYAEIAVAWVEGGGAPPGNNTEISVAQLVADGAVELDARLAALEARVAALEAPGRSGGP